MKRDTEHPQEEISTPPDEKDAAKKTKRAISLVLLLLITFSSAGLRFAGINRHYPYMNYVDEGHIIRHAQNMYHGQTLDPHWYQYTAGMMHLTNLGVWSYVHLTGQQEGFRELVRVYPYVNYFRDNYPAAIEANYNSIDPPIFLYIGRLITVLAGALSILAFYAFVRQTLPGFLPVAATFLFAFIPGLVQHNYCVNNDIPMMLLFTVMLWMMLAWRHQPVWWRIVIAGLCAGAASSFKMPGVLYAGLPLLICLFQPIPIRKRISYAVVLFFSCVAGAYCMNPGLRGTEMLVYKTLLWDMEFYATHGTTPKAIDVLLRPAVLGGTMLVLGGMGLLGACFDKEQRRFALACLLWLIPFLWLFLRNDYQPVRNLYPLMPMLVFFACWAIWRITALPARKRTRLALLLAVLIILALGGMQLVRSLQGHQRWWEKENSRILTAEWIMEHAGKGSTVAVPEGVAISPWVMRSMARDKRIAFCRIENLTYTVPYLNTDYVILPRALSGKSASEQPLLDALITQLRASGKEVVYTSPGKGGVDLYWGYYHYPPIPLDIWSQHAQQ